MIDLFSCLFRKIQQEDGVPSHGTAGIFRQKSINSAERSLSSSIGDYARRAARHSFGAILSSSRKMALTSSQSSIPWPNTKDDYELGKVIGSFNNIYSTALFSLVRNFIDFGLT